LFIIVSSYRAKAGEEDAVIALHEDWLRTQRQHFPEYLRWELFNKLETPTEFVAVASFANKDVAQAATSKLEQGTWYHRLLSLLETAPVHVSCTRAWYTP
jgi:hypothetical protein